MSEGQSPGVGGVARRLRDRVKSALASSGDAGRAPAPRRESAPADTSAAPAPAAGKQGLLGKLAADRQEAQAAQEQLDKLTAERDELREQRLQIQQELGSREGKSVMPRLKVEKTNNGPTFIANQRMLQRIYARSESPAGLDGLDGLFADPAETARYARSHGVPVLEDPSTAEADVIVHAFKNVVGLVEVRSGDSVRHFEEDGTDPGDIRPAATYDATIGRPEGFDDVCTWSRTLSRFIPRPYVQLHWSSTPQGPRLHHVEVDPDRLPVLTPEWDEKLGGAFDAAYTRFLKQANRRGGLDNRIPGGIFTPEEHP